MTPKLVNKAIGDKTQMTIVGADFNGTNWPQQLQTVEELVSYIDSGTKKLATSIAGPRNAEARKKLAAIAQKNVGAANIYLEVSKVAEQAAKAAFMVAEQLETSYTHVHVPGARTSCECTDTLCDDVQIEEEECEDQIATVSKHAESAWASAVQAREYAEILCNDARDKEEEYEDQDLAELVRDIEEAADMVARSVEALFLATDLMINEKWLATKVERDGFIAPMACDHRRQQENKIWFEIVGDTKVSTRYLRTYFPYTVYEKGSELAVGNRDSLCPKTGIRQHYGGVDHDVYINGDGTTWTERAARYREIMGDRKCVNTTPEMEELLALALGPA